MKLNTMNNKIEDIEDIEPEYDFSNGIRGKHYKEFACGYTVTVYSPNKSTCDKQIVKKSNFIQIDEDIQDYFKNPKEVNNALRTYIHTKYKTKKNQFQTT